MPLPVGRSKWPELSSMAPLIQWESEQWGLPMYSTGKWIGFDKCLSLSLQMSLLLVSKYGFPSFSHSGHSHTFSEEVTQRSSLHWQQLKVQEFWVTSPLTTGCVSYGTTTYELKTQIIFLCSHTQCAMVRQGQNSHIDTFSEKKGNWEMLSRHWSEASLKHHWANWEGLLQWEGWNLLV